MPGPVSDSYDPEFGTGANAHEIRQAVKEIYDKVTSVLEGKPPIYILDLVRGKDLLRERYHSMLTEWEWRIIRFALERADESI